MRESKVIARRIDGDATSWEQEALKSLGVECHLRHTTITAFGKLLTPSAIEVIYKNYGSRVVSLGSCGDLKSSFLDRTVHTSHRQHRLQGCLAASMAASIGCQVVGHGAFT